MVAELEGATDLVDLTGRVKQAGTTNAQTWSQKLPPGL